MHRRSFLSSTAALAAAPALPMHSGAAQRLLECIKTVHEMRWADEKAEAHIGRVSWDKPDVFHEGVIVDYKIHANYSILPMEIEQAVARGRDKAAHTLDLIRIRRYQMLRATAEQIADKIGCKIVPKNGEAGIVS